MIRETAIQFCIQDFKSYKNKSRLLKTESGIINIFFLFFIWQYSQPESPLLRSLLPAPDKSYPFVFFEKFQRKG